MTKGVSRAVDLIGAARTDDPHPIYHELRHREPVHWSEQLRGWVLTRYSDCVELLKRPDFSADRITPMLRELPAPARERLADFARFVKPWILVLDAPAHTRIRNLMARAFTARTVEQMRPRIRTIARELLAARRERDRLDIIHDLAYPLPATVIADMLGVPPADLDRFKAWSDDVAAFVGSFTLDEAVLGRATQSLRHLTEYFRTLIEERRRAPSTDLLTTMIQARDEGQSLSDDELLANCSFLLFAGHETTTNLIGNGLLWLLRNPDQHQLLRDKRALVPIGVEEMLRYDPPVDRISRIATKDTTIAGTSIAAGERVIALTTAANRDPTQFPDPDRFDVTRTDNRHLAFGMGAHFCIGGPLARVEAQEVFAELFDTFRSIELEPAPTEWVDSLGFRGLRRLPVRVRAAR